MSEDLISADLSSANLSEANLSGAKNFPNAQGFLQQFESDEKGVIVFKAIGQTDYPSPTTWKIAPGEFLTENVGPCPVNDCSCGINFGTLEYVKSNYIESAIWKCRINWLDLAGVVVPYHTTGKARCNRLELLQKIQ